MCGSKTGFPNRFQTQHTLKPKKSQGKKMRTEDADYVLSHMILNHDHEILMCIWDAGFNSFKTFNSLFQFVE